MTPDQFKKIRKGLGLSVNDMAKKLRMSPENGERTIRKWESPENIRGIPGPVQVAIEFFLKEKK